MKVGEIYTYDSYYSSNMIRIREVYFDTFYKRASVKYNIIGLCLDNMFYYHYESTGIGLLKNNRNFKKATKKDWYRVIRQYNERYKDWYREKLSL